MQQTPHSNRAHIVIIGETNAGKSALFNAVLGQEAAIVSATEGTTTDPVTKAMELLPYGPIVLIDTAGLNDGTVLGQTRVQKSLTVLDKADYVLVVCDAGQRSTQANLRQRLTEKGTPHLLVFTKKDTIDQASLAAKLAQTENAVAVSVFDAASVQALKDKIAAELAQNITAERSLVAGFVPAGGVVAMVVPLDAGAPKGRLILPQVQFLRDCLDNGVRCNVTTPEYLPELLAESTRIDLVVTDSQIFKAVDTLVPPETRLTSFSILMARQKGDLQPLLEGASKIKDLREGDRILIAEVCTHNQSHEDIGRVKIPKMLKEATGRQCLHFDFCTGKDYPENLGQYALVVHCGGCMMTPKEMTFRLQTAVRYGVPITNYGVVLAYCYGILARAVAIFDKR